MRRILLMFILLLIIAVAGILFMFKQDTANPYVQPCDYSVPLSEIPTFNEAQIGFSHSFNEAEALPLMGACLIDIDNDGTDELFFGGGIGQADILYKYENGAFRDITGEQGLGSVNKTNTLGAASYDLDGDCKVDLIITRKDGLFLARNIGAGFETQKIAVPVNERSTTATVTLGDYNRDGLIDIFLATYIKLELMEGQTIFNKKDYGSTSLLLKNNGNLEFEDVTKSVGLEYVHNTFQGVFVDINKDGWLDLVVAYDTGEARTYRNNNGISFSIAENPITGKFGYPMGVAVGDYNNDSNIDFFFSNTGSTVPRFMAKGDLNEGQELVLDWMLFRNDGEFKFADTAKEAKVADFEFSWGAIFADFNNDGKQDLVVAENYVAFPAHKLFKLPCRFLLQRDNHQFAAVEEQAGVVNRNYAITPLASDFNGDGFLDLAYSNLGGPAKVYINNGGQNNYVKVRIPETGVNAGAHIEVQTKNGETLSDAYVIGEGLSSDQSNTLVFGMGADNKPTEIRVTFTNGQTRIVENPETNSIYTISAETSFQ